MPKQNSVLTALPIWVAHLKVPAGSGRVLSGSIRAADLLDLLAQALQGAVHLKVTVSENISIISTEHAEGIRCLLLGLCNEAKVKSATGGTRGSSRSRGSRGTLKRLQKCHVLHISVLPSFKE